MAASLAERLKLKQYQVDTWTNREQLCLVSAVMRSGDQNCWVAVRRNIKMLTNETKRPADWYSTKNCALQYGKLLERVDTPKRKRERGDGGNETPGEIVTKMLTKQRVEELRAQESEERASYTRLRQDVQQLEAGLLDHKLDALWDQLIKEQAEEEEEEQRHQQWLKEREEKITAIQQALKHQGPKVTMPPHKKKQKSHIGGIGSAGGSRRNSGLSETSSEVDSTVDSPDLNEATPESLVSNKSQDEGGGGESEVRPTPASPLLTTLLSKSPLTPAPLPPIPSPLSQRGVRGLAFSPVSEALQNLVTSAISGTDSTDKDKTSHTTSPSSGSLTLSRLLDLPPSTPGQPLPRLSDLPGPTFHHREQEKESEPVKTPTKESDSCGDNKGCSDGEAVKDCPSKEEEKTPESSVTDAEVDDAGGVLEDERKDSLLRGGKEGAKEEEELKKPESLDQEILDLKETSTPGSSEAQQQKQTTEEKCEDMKSKSKEPLEEANLTKTSRKSEVEETTDKKSEGDESKTEGEAKTEDADIFGDFASLKAVVEKEEVKEEEPSTSKVEKEEDGDGEREQAHVEEGEVESKKGKEDCSNKMEDVKGEVEGKVVGEPHVENNDGNEPEKKAIEEDLFSKIPKIEEFGTGSDLERKVKKTYQRREPEEDLDKEDSKGWVSEEESSSTSSRKRKISGGDPLLGCSSPLISESAPNSPASTHCGDDSECEKAYRSWKKPIMILWNEIAAHKFASLFLRPITDEKAPGYHSVVYRAMDLQKIKRNIESGLIRTTAEFQRDIMLMFLNATMYNTRDHNVYHMAYQMMKDAVSTIEDFLNTQMLARAEDTPQKSLRRETRESSAKRTDDDPKRKREPLDEKSLKKRRL